MSTALSEGQNSARYVIDVTKDSAIDRIDAEGYKEFPPRYYAIEKEKRVPVTVWNDDQKRFIKGVIRGVTDMSCFVEYELSIEEQRALRKKKGYEWLPLKDFQDIIVVTGMPDAEKENPTTTAKTRILSGRERFSKAYAKICAGRPYQVKKEADMITHPEDRRKNIKVFTLEYPVPVRIHDRLARESIEDAMGKCLVVAVTADQQFFQVVRNYDEPNEIETTWIPAEKIDPPLYFDPS